MLPQITKQQALLSVKMPPELNKRIEKHVTPMGMSKTAFILSLINRELAQSDRPVAIPVKEEDSV